MIINCYLCHGTLRKSLLSSYLFTEDGIAHEYCFKASEINSLLLIKKKRKKPGRKQGRLWGKEAEDPEFRFDYDEEIYCEIHQEKLKLAGKGFPGKVERTMRKGKTLHKI